MNAESLLASAAMNIGLALFVLTLFSIFKKRPSNAFIYFARRIAKDQAFNIDRSFTFTSFFPSVSWIVRALRVSEDEIMQASGLDALVIFRLFKFGIKFFLACFVIGVMLLLPINYSSQRDPYRSRPSRSLDSFTISNIGTGSNRLWVHFTCLYFISFYGMCLLYKEYNEILVRRTRHLQNVRDRPDQFTVLVREIPFCKEHTAYGCCVNSFFSRHHPHSYLSYQMVYDGKEIEDLLISLFFPSAITNGFFGIVAFRHQAKSIARKIEGLRHKSNHIRGSMFMDLFRGNVEELGAYEERLHDLCHRIRHMQCKDILKEKELPVAFVSFKSRRSATLVSQSQQHENPLLWITELAPEPRDVLWKNLVIPCGYRPLNKTVVFVAASLLTIFFAIPVTAVQGIVRFEKLKKWFPPAMAVQLIPGLSSVVTGYLPSVILSMFIYVVPFAMLSIATLEGFVSKSKREIKACSMVFYFLVGNVFFLSLLSGSLLDQIGESFTHPKDFPSHLASAVSAQADFFMTYILTTGLSGFSLEVLQPGLLIWDFICVHTFGRGKSKNPYLFSLPYCRIIPFISLTILVGMVYVVIAPLLLPFIIVNLFLGYVVYMNQIENVYDIVYETGGQYWPYIHHYIIVAIILMQITMIGLFSLKSKPAAAISTIPLFLFTLLFNEYCKIRFLPTFFNYSVQNAVENDEHDEVEGAIEVNSETAIDAYLPPCMKPLTFTSQESSSTQPLVTTT